MACKARKKITVTLFAFISSLAFFASCATSPRFSFDFPEGGEFAALDGGGAVYFSIDVKAARPILDKAKFGGIRGGEISRILDYTGSAVGAVYPQTDSSAGFLFFARGNFPVSQAGAFFNLSSLWKRVKSPAGNRYWYSREEKLSVYLEPGLALVSNGGDPFSRTGSVLTPPALSQYRSGSCIAGWLEDAAGPMNKFFAQLAVPIQIPAERLIFAVYAAGPSSYYAVFRLETPSPSQAKGLSAAIAMFRLFTAGTASSGNLPASQKAVLALFANTPEVDGRDLILQTGVLDAETIALLFNMFSVYSK
ncbi:MAG: hypothetical protein LBT16_03435 [Treponema sp.]|jgi:hypothetical protein|nr:hypothetical protein [Treponema sp.]